MFIYISFVKKCKMDTSFERSANTKVEWLIPPELVKKLGEFDLDPCCPVNAQFVHAKTNFTIEDNGLNKEWFGRVFCNPPYGKDTTPLWLDKLWLRGRISLSEKRGRPNMAISG
jgi:hypothetical protein